MKLEVVLALKTTIHHQKVKREVKKSEKQLSLRGFNLSAKRPVKR